MTTMTVKELRDKLAEMPDDLPVRTEGCDCDGDAASVIFEEGDSSVYISRESESWWQDYHKRHREYEAEQEAIAAEQRSRGLIA